MTRKRANNEGSIYKRLNGSWAGQVTLQGKRISQTFRTQKECLEWLKKIRGQIDGGMTIANTQLNLSEYMQEWLVIAKTRLRQTTWTHYEQLNRLYISVKLGKIKLKDLRVEHIRTFYNQLLENGIGSHTIRKIHALLQKALQEAAEDGTIPSNPASLANQPRKPDHKKMFLTISQVDQMLLAAKRFRLEALYQLAIDSGMRESELLGLMWTDLDWVRSSLKIERQLERPDGNGVKFAPPKTEHGERTILLSKLTIVKLREHYERQQNERKAIGDAWREYGLIFTTTIGTPIHQRNLLRDFKNLMKQAGLPPIRFHDLRHTAASIWLNYGIPVIIVSRRLGHARPSITSDIYGHLLTESQDQPANLIDELFALTEVKLEDTIFKS